MNINVNDLGVNFISKCIDIYNGNGTFYYMGVYFAILIFMLFNRFKKYRDLFVYPVILLIMTLFNPFICHFVVNKLNLESRFYRFFWILPITITISFVLVRIIVLVNNKKKKVFLIFIIIFGLIIIGDFDNTLNNYSIIQNPYKISEDVIQISDIIHSDNDSKDLVLFYDQDLMKEYRTYDPSVKSVMSRNQALWSLDDKVDTNDYKTIQQFANYKRLLLVIRYGIKIDKYLFISSMDALKINYIIQKKDIIDDSFYYAMGLSKISSTDNYVIYKYK